MKSQRDIFWGLIMDTHMERVGDKRQREKAGKHVN